LYHGGGLIKRHNFPTAIIPVARLNVSITETPTGDHMAPPYQRKECLIT